MDDFLIGIGKRLKEIRKKNALTINEENRLKRQVKELTQKSDRFACLEEKIQQLNKKLGLE